MAQMEDRSMSSIALPRISARDHSESLRPLALAAPLLLLLLFSFLAPIASLLSRGVYEPTIANALPRTIAALRQDSGAGVPGEPVFVALATDLKEAQAAGTLNEFAKALNIRLPGARSQVLRAARYAAQRPVAEQGRVDQSGAASGPRAGLDGDPEQLEPIYFILFAQRLRSALDRPRRDQFCAS